MADGWRNRYMAPFYALIISFALVFLLGTLLEDTSAAPPTPKAKPTAEEPTTDPAPSTPTVTFEAKGAKTFPGTGLTLVQGDMQTPLPKLDDLPELAADDEYVICAVLKPDWTAVDAIQVPGSAYSCWGPFDPNSNEPSVLRAERSE